MTSLPALRASVDEVDRELQRLVTRRRELSLAIQGRRLRDGGARHDRARELEVVASYEDALGPGGAELAEVLLRLCRGTLGQATGR